MLDLLDAVSRTERKIDRWLPPEPSTKDDGPIWEPVPDSPQVAALNSEADELFYGGAAGGGKTDLLLGAAFTRHRRSIIFRREYPQLAGVEERAEEIAGGRGSYNGQKNLWRMDDGRRVEFGAVQHEKSVSKYQGRPHDLKGFDEITHFSEAQYRFLGGWKRTATLGQRTRTIACGNPPLDTEGQWVIQYWGPWLDPEHPNPAEPGELRWYAVIDGEDVEVDGPEPIEHEGETIRPTSRTFIPAKVEDNPYYMATGYKQTLQGLPEPLRSQLLEGDFQARPDADPFQVIPVGWVMAAQERWKKREPEGPMSALGVDVARGGKDKTVLAPRWGTYYGALVSRAGSETPDGQTVAGLVVQNAQDNATVLVDVIGVGASAYDHTKPLVADCRAVNVAAKSHGTDRTGRFRFANLRSEMYWKMREALDPEHGNDLALPPSASLRADLCSARWTVQAGGVIRIESKDEIKKRIGRSPDEGDAVLLAGAPVVSPSTLVGFA